MSSLKYFLLICFLALAAAKPRLPILETSKEAKSDQMEIRAEDLQQDSSDFLDADNEEPSELDDDFTEEDLAELEEFADLEAAELDEAEADPSLAIRVRVQRPLSGFGYIRRPLLIRQRLYPSFRLRYRLLPLFRIGYGIPQPTIVRPQILPGCTPCLASSGLGVTCC